jgi:iron complex transport system ATP-binding protein
MSSSSPLLSCSGLDVTVLECALVEQLTLQLQPGTITAVLGRNGTGKSLTLQTLAGLRAASQGEIMLNNRELRTLPRREIAQQLSFVAQESEEPFPVTVLECALSGRHPHIDFWQWETAEDYAIARTALAAVDLQHFESRSIDTLSGGERRRLAIACALAQQPQIFILDEPTNHLDPQHQLQRLKLLRSKADAGCAVIMSLHDPNLALRFADHALLLFGDSRWRYGPCCDTLVAEALTQLYNTPIQTLFSGSERYFVSL